MQKHPQVAEVQLAAAIVQNEGGFWDFKPVVGADATLQRPRALRMTAER
jgi:hypothetical protein